MEVVLLLRKAFRELQCAVESSELRNVLCSTFTVDEGAAQSETVKVQSVFVDNNLWPIILLEKLCLILALSNLQFIANQLNNADSLQCHGRNTLYLQKPNEIEYIFFDYFQ